jgi:hypothetical protein
VDKKGLGSSWFLDAYRLYAYSTMPKAASRDGNVDSIINVDFESSSASADKIEP